MKAVTKKEWKRKKRYPAWCSLSTDKKARNNGRTPDTAKLRWKARLSVLDTTFGCFYQISRKQRLLVETLYVS